jgi:hypothetical protein
MTNLKNHLNADASLMTLFTNRFSRHPERYIEIFGGKFAWNSLQKTLLRGDNKRK